MKRKFVLWILLLAAAIWVSCKKDSGGPGTTTRPNSPSDTAHTLSPTTMALPSCPNRPVVMLNLEQVGSLSVARSAMSAATAGSKILFAGGSFSGVGYSSRVDIYDTITKNWSTAELSVTERQGMAVATLGNKVFFAGGLDADNGTPITSRVDIYDAATNRWSTDAVLSSPRAYLAAATLGNRVFFAGGANWTSGHFSGLDVVDIYDDNTHSWTTAKLGQGRYELTATTVGSKIYFAGGITDMYNISGAIDIYDSVSNTWSTSQLQDPRTGHVGILAGNKILWAGGAKTSYQSGYLLYNNTETRDLSSGLSSFECFTPKAFFSAVKKDDNIIFFPGWDNGPLSPPGDTVDIYNTSRNTWSKGALPAKMRLEAVVSVNNEIYVAGGEINGSSIDAGQVWKLKF